MTKKYICNQDCILKGKRYSVGEALAEGVEANKFFDEIEVAEVALIETKAADNANNDEIIKQMNEALSKAQNAFEQKIGELEKRVVQLENDVKAFNDALSDIPEDDDGLSQEDVGGLDINDESKAPSSPIKADNKTAKASK